MDEKGRNGTCESCDIKSFELDTTIEFFESIKMTNSNLKFNFYYHIMT